MTRHSGRKYFAVAFALLMVLSMAGPAVGTAAASTGETPNQQAISEKQIAQQNIDNTFDVPHIDNLSVWEGSAARPAIVDRSDGVTTIESQNVFVDTTASGVFSSEISINTDQEAVFEAGQNVTFDLDDDRGTDTSDLDNEDFRVLVAHVEPDVDSTQALLDAENVSVKDVRDTFEGDEDFEEFNRTVQNQEEVRFEDVRDFFEGTDEFEDFADTIAEDQEISIDRLIEVLDSDEFQDLVTFSAVGPEKIENDNTALDVGLDDGPGAYVFIGHVGNEVLADGEERPTFNETTVVGADAIVAQETSSKINDIPSEVELGDNVTVDATSNLGGDNISHSVLVFDEDTWSETETTLKLDGVPNADLRSENVTVISDIESIQGVARVEPNTMIRGITLADERFEGEVDTETGADTFFSVRDAFVDGFDIRSQVGGAASFDLGDTTINASATAVGGLDDDATIDVETLNEWEAGEYTVVHVATDQESGNISTTRESVDLVETVTPDISVTAADVSTTDVDTGEDFDVTADVQNIGGADGSITLEVTVDGDVEESRTISVSANDDITEQFTISIDDSGEFNIAVNGVTAGTVTVSGDTPPRRGSSGGISSTPDPEDSPVETDVTERDGGASISVVNIQANTPTRIDAGTGVSAGGSSVTAFTIDMVEDLDELNIEVDASENAPADTPAVDIGDDISYVSVDAGDLTDDDYNSVEWEFSVSQDRLDEMDRDAEEVRLNRYNEATDEWESLETTHEGDNEFTSEAPGFSEFAISTASGPDMSVVDVELATTEVEADEPFDVMATVENEGETAGDITLELTVDGEVVETTDVTIDGEDTAERTLTGTVDESGEYEIAVNNVVAGDLTVLEEGEVVDRDDDTPLVLILILVVVLIALAGGAYYYTQEMDQN